MASVCMAIHHDVASCVVLLRTARLKEPRGEVSSAGAHRRDGIRAVHAGL